MEKLNEIKYELMDKIIKQNYLNKENYLSYHEKHLLQ